MTWLLSLTPFEIGLVLSGFLVFMVVIGMRVAFAAALTGFLGLWAIFTQRTDSMERGLEIAMKMAGTVPHSKATTYALSLIPTFILIGYLAFHAGLTTLLV